MPLLPYSVVEKIKNKRASEKHRGALEEKEAEKIDRNNELIEAEALLQDV